jgi:hypothetical protein
MLGAIVDEQDLAARIAKALRLAGGLVLIESEQVALAVGLRLGTTTTIGNAADLGHRSSAQPIGFGGGRKSARVGARDSVPTAAVAPAAVEIAGELSKRLMFRVREIREHAAIGLFVTLDEPSAPMRQEATTAGVYHSELWNRDYPRLQLLTIRELLDGKRPQIPPFVLPTYQRAERVPVKKAAEQGELFG